MTAVLRYFSERHLLDSNGDLPSQPTVGEIHLWSADLRSLRSLVDQHLLAPLPPVDTLRAEKFAPGRKEAFVVARSYLRTILASYLGIMAERIEFEYGLEGKPSISKTQNPENLVFNLSHSGSQLVIAISTNRKLGIDLEVLRPPGKERQIADRYFTEPEKAYLKSISDEAAFMRAFFRIWTAKEAFAKARGTSLFQVFAEIEIIPQMNQQSNWQMIEVDAGPEAVCTLFVEKF